MITGGFRGSPELGIRAAWHFFVGKCWWPSHDNATWEGTRCIVQTAGRPPPARSLTPSRCFSAVSPSRSLGPTRRGVMVLSLTYRSMPWNESKNSNRDFRATYVAEKGTA